MNIRLLSYLPLFVLVIGCSEKQKSIYYHSGEIKSKGDDCYCIDIGLGAKVILGIEINLKVGLTE